jgi:hypothetical protein
VSDTVLIFMAGIVAFLLVAGGLAFTIYEVPRLTRLGLDGDSTIRKRRAE